MAGCWRGKAVKSRYCRGLSRALTRRCWELEAGNDPIRVLPSDTPPEALDAGVQPGEALGRKVFAERSSVMPPVMRGAACCVSSCLDHPHLGCMTQHAHLQFGFPGSIENWLISCLVLVCMVHDRQDAACHFNIVPRVTKGGPPPVWPLCLKGE